MKSNELLSNINESKLNKATLNSCARGLILFARYELKRQKTRLRYITRHKNASLFLIQI